MSSGVRSVTYLLHYKPVGKILKLQELYDINMTLELYAQHLVSICCDECLIFAFSVFVTLQESFRVISVFVLDSRERHHYDGSERLNPLICISTP